MPLPVSLPIWAKLCQFVHFLCQIVHFSCQFVHFSCQYVHFLPLVRNLFENLRFARHFIFRQFSRMGCGAPSSSMSIVSDTIRTFVVYLFVASSLLRARVVRLAFFFLPFRGIVSLILPFITSKLYLDISYPFSVLCLRFP